MTRNRRPELLRDLLPAVAADLAARNHRPIGDPVSDPDQYLARTVAEVFARANVILDGPAAVDAELLEIANKSGGTLLRYCRGEDDGPFAAVAHTVTMAAALRKVLGFSDTPTPAELVAVERAATKPRPECCPDCGDIGLCDPDCETAAENSWPREVAWTGADA